MQSGKVLCGHKHKFGLSSQATCDFEGRFLDIEMSHPTSTSDCLAFNTSNIEDQLEEPGFLSPGLCLFGDDACPNRHCMATPHSNVRSSSKDNHNFCHSQVSRSKMVLSTSDDTNKIPFVLRQVCVEVECSFGMLVIWWDILRKAMSSTLSLQKIGALTLCLCGLHNFSSVSMRELPGRKATKRTLLSLLLLTVSRLPMAEEFHWKKAITILN